MDVLDSLRPVETTGTGGKDRSLLMTGVLTPGAQCEDKA